MYAIATGLRGFRSSSLRVQVERVDGNYAWVRTADLVDAGTPLVLDVDQIFDVQVDDSLRHKAGLVAIG